MLPALIRSCWFGSNGGKFHLHYMQRIRRVRVTHDFSGHHVPVGKIISVRQVHKSDRNGCYYTENGWFINTLEFKDVSFKAYYDNIRET